MSLGSTLSQPNRRARAVALPVGAGGVRRYARAPQVVNPSQDDEDSPRPLTPRQMDISHLLARGLTRKQIGDELGLTEATVKDYVHAIFCKVGVGTSTAFVLWYRKNVREEKLLCDVALGRREADVLGELKQGRSTKEIGHNLGITESVVKLHIARMMAKARVHSRVLLLSCEFPRRVERGRVTEPPADGDPRMGAFE